MKNNLLIPIILLFTIRLSAQEKLIPYPRLSPFQKTETTIGPVKINIEYCRPSMRGRHIFGGLEKHGAIWRTGANKNTKITFSEPIVFGGKAIDAGTYTLFTKPDKTQWEVYLYPLIDAYGVPENLDSFNIIASVSVVPKTLHRSIESLSIGLESFTARSAILAIAWERTYVGIPIEVDLDEFLSDNIQKAEALLASDYSTAAWTYYDIQKDLDNALIQIEKSIALRLGGQSFEQWCEQITSEDPVLPWVHWIKSQIHADQGQKEQAIQEARRSLKVAEIVGSVYYQKEAKNDIAKWATK